MIAAVIVAVVAAVVIVALAVAMVRARQDAAMAQHQTDALRVELADARQETVSAVAPLAEPVVPLSPIAESPTPAPRPGRQVRFRLARPHAAHNSPTSRHPTLAQPLRAHPKASRH